MQHVVVLGGSIAGLTAARVLSQAGVRVTIVEPDSLSDGLRTGVPQHRQLHALLDMGRTQLDRMFPHLTRDLVAEGASLGAGEEIEMYVAGARKFGVPGNELVGVTRELLESHIRRRVSAEQYVTTVRGKACGLDFNGPRVSGIRYWEPDSGVVRGLQADAVVDAMGRSSRLSAWLEKHGWEAPPLERMRIDLGYATALFRRGDDLRGLKIVHAVPDTRAPLAELGDTGALAAVENNQWMVLIAGFGDGKPTPDPDEFRERMRRIGPRPFRVIAERCDMLTDVTTYSMAHSQRRRFGKLKALPGGLFAVGDSVASYNPVYGQGMTSAVLHASCLAAHVRRRHDLRDPAWAYFEHLAVFVDAAWDLSTLSDLALPHVTGPYPLGYPVTKRLFDWINRASIADRRVNQALLDVVNMKAHPSVLRSPRFLAGVGRALLPTVARR
ncbi:NAD(P)/FAD-dependent oxidoreductase [Streptomyces sp. MNP-20]|uniref:FAD-dependent oxidoreductase n=1 Tax=Streptomyces sp. MNP-20 TaxID=2721165 RepID=UPI0015516A43|nr:FAD-dependent monooxygenase [Streptomyces sp. MNP-20]